MICIYCGAQIADSANYCTHCGNAVVSSPPAEEMQKHTVHRDGVVWAEIAAFIAGIIALVYGAGRGIADYTSMLRGLDYGSGFFIFGYLIVPLGGIAYSVPFMVVSVILAIISRTGAGVKSRELRVTSLVLMILAIILIIIGIPVALLLFVTSRQ